MFVIYTRIYNIPSSRKKERPLFGGFILFLIKWTGKLGVQPTEVLGTSEDKRSMYQRTRKGERSRERNDGLRGGK